MINEKAFKNVYPEVISMNMQDPFSAGAAEACSTVLPVPGWMDTTSTIPSTTANTVVER